MDFVPDLFDSHDFDRQEPEEKSGGGKWLIGGLVAGVAVAVGIIAYYGVGPMLVAPAISRYPSNAPDVAEVLGLQGEASSPALSDALDEAARGELEDRLQLLVEDLPQERPDIFMVLDATKLGDNAFFTNGAQNDVLFVYRSTGVAYSYRPAEHQLINTGKVEVSQ